MGGVEQASEDFGRNRIGKELGTNVAAFVDRPVHGPFFSFREILVRRAHTSRILTPFAAGHDPFLDRVLAFGLIRQPHKIGRQLARGVNLQGHSYDELARELTGFLHDELEVYKAAKKQRVGRIAVNGVQFEDTARMQVWDCAAQLPRKGHVVAFEKSARGWNALAGELPAHGFQFIRTTVSGIVAPAHCAAGAQPPCQGLKS